MIYHDTIQFIDFHTLYITQIGAKRALYVITYKTRQAYLCFYYSGYYKRLF